MKNLFPIIFLSLIACNNSNDINSKLKNSKNHILDFNAFTIETPETWKKVEEKGIDSYVGGIVIDEKDTLFFDLGWYSNKLNEDPPRIIERYMLEKVKIEDSTDLIIVENIRKIDFDKYRKQNIIWDTIDNYNAKIVFPIRPGIGMTGVYIDSLWGSEYAVDKFNLYGSNLKPENEKVLLKAIRTIKFNKK